MLHIRCGDDILPKLSGAGLPGQFIKWCDPLCQGPTPAGQPLDKWRTLRAQFIAAHYHVTCAEALSELTAQDQALERFHEHEEVVLWFEHDLFDQIILIYLLDWFAKQVRGRTKLSLICIGQYPGVKPFWGLGQLSTEQLVTLYDRRHEVTAAETELAIQAWSAFQSPAPAAIEAFVRRDCEALPFLRGALVRHLQQFPSVRNGLNLTEQLALEVIASDQHQPAQIFKQMQMNEHSPWLGDTMFWPYLQAMMEGRTPLLVINGAGPWPSHGLRSSQVTLHLTPQGHAVLIGQADRISMNGIDRWLGGVHLRGQEARWRWDPGAQHLVQRDTRG